MELILCLGVAILVVSARTSSEWSAAAQAVPPGTVMAKAAVRIVQWLSFVCAGFAMGLVGGALTLAFGDTRWNVGVAVLIAFTGPVAGVLIRGAILTIRAWGTSAKMPHDLRSRNNRDQASSMPIDSLVIR